MNRIIGLLILLLSFGSMAYASQAKEIVIAVQPSANPQQLTTQAKEIEDILSQKLGQPVKIFFPTSYAGVIEALHYGHAQVAFMGSWPALLAKTKADAKVILAEVRQVMVDNKMGEATHYYSYWVVGKDSVFNDVAQLKGKRVAFPSQLSSSGYIAPLAKMVSLGLISPKDGKAADAKDFFSQVLFAGGYPQGYEALKAGQVDVSIIAGDVPEKLYNEVLANTKVVGQQGPIPSHTVVVAKDVDDELKSKITEALLSMNDPQYRNLMRKFVSGIFVRFTKADESHLAPLNEMVDLTKIEFTEKK